MEAKEKSTTTPELSPTSLLPTAAREHLLQYLVDVVTDDEVYRRHIEQPHPQMPATSPPLIVVAVAAIHSGPQGLDRDQLHAILASRNVLDYLREEIRTTLPDAWLEILASNIKLPASQTILALSKSRDS